MSERLLKNVWETLSYMLDSNSSWSLAVVYTCWWVAGMLLSHSLLFWAHLRIGDSAVFDVPPLSTIICCCMTLPTLQYFVGLCRAPDSDDPPHLKQHDCDQHLRLLES